MWKTIVRRGVISLCALLFLPERLWRGFFRLWLACIGRREPRNALRTLLALDEQLELQINATAIHYGGGVHAKHRLMDYHTFFTSRIQPGERVLDIGCGYGAVAYSVATKCGALVTGIDLNAQSLVFARKKFQHPTLTFVAGDALTDLPDQDFDTIVISNVLEHIEHRVEFLRKTQEKVRARRWMIRVPMFNRSWEVPLRQELGMFPYGDPTHFTEYTRESFDEEMDSAGLFISHLQVNWGEIWAVVQSTAKAERKAA